ncbi:uncharacterized protein ACB058_016067 [Synchiropus picturatus]
MEHNAIQWLGAPSCHRGSFTFYKSVSSRTGPDSPVQVWKLGEFYFIRWSPEESPCIAEVTLLWEERTQHHLLASARLYYLPEDTPKGRTREHGEDEVLVVARKMVVRVEDLVRWSCGQPSEWSSSLKLRTPKADGAETQSAADVASMVGKPLKEEPGELRRVKVLSYPQYCRFRSLQRRIQDAASGPSLEDVHLLALGGLRLQPNTRLMYCREMFHHPTLENSTSFSWQFRSPSLSLRGRPRKKTNRDSRESPSQPDSWLERMKENVMGSVEVGSEGGWLPDPEEQLFLDQLFAFMEHLGSPIHKVPNLGFKKINLFLMYSVVKRLGGYDRVTSERLWKVVYNELGGCPSSTSAATCTRRHYERLMLPYERHLGTGGKLEEIPESSISRKPKGVRGRKPFPRGRKPGSKPKIAAAPSVIRNPDGSVVVKRGRGRPPGKRNKSSGLNKVALPQWGLLPARAIAPTTALSNPLQVSKPFQAAIFPTHVPLTPDLSPMASPFLPFQTKVVEHKPDPARNVASGVLLPTLPCHVISGSLDNFSPLKSVCPLDVLTNRAGLKKGPALTPQNPQEHLSIYNIKPTQETPQSPRHQTLHQPHLLHQQNNKDSRTRPPMPPLRVLPLDLDCSVQVRQLMRTRLGSSQFQTFTRRLSEALSQDMSPKNPPSPITPPPDQSLPLNLSKRFLGKRPSTDSQGQQTSPTSPTSKKVKSGTTEPPESIVSGGTGKEDSNVVVKDQEEPADLSSPSRIRAFLLGLPPFQVKLEEDLNGMRLSKFLSAEPGLAVENLVSKEEMEANEVKEEVAAGASGNQHLDQKDPTSVDSTTIQVEFVKGDEVERGREVLLDEQPTVLAQSGSLVLTQQS